MVTALKQKVKELEEENAELGESNDVLRRNIKLTKQKETEVHPEL